MAEIPNRFNWNTKRHFEQELLSFATDNDGKFLITRDETREIIREFLKQESSQLFTDLDHRLNSDVEALRDLFAENVEKKFADVEKHINAYLTHRVDKIAEAIVDRLTNRNFEAEVVKAVQRRLNNRGKF